MTEMDAATTDADSETPVKGHTQNTAVRRSPRFMKNQKTRRILEFPSTSTHFTMDHDECK